jgi:hypothetical protein
VYIHIYILSCVCMTTHTERNIGQFKKESLPFVIRWMDLRDIIIMTNEISQTQKENFHLCVESQKSQICRDRK